jgi:hypothetical protein
MLRPPARSHWLLELWNHCGAIKRYSGLYLEITLRGWLKSFSAISHALGAMLASGTERNRPAVTEHQPGRAIFEARRLCMSTAPNPPTALTVGGFFFGARPTHKVRPPRGWVWRPRGRSIKLLMPKTAPHTARALPAIRTVDLDQASAGLSAAAGDTCEEAETLTGN